MSTEQQAKLLEEIAAVMRERPEDGFLQFERRCQSHWRSITSWRYLMSDLKDCPGDVRRPRTITIAGEISTEAAKEIKSRAAGVPGEAGRKWREIAALIGEVE